MLETDTAPPCKWSPKESPATPARGSHATGTPSTEVPPTMDKVSANLMIRKRK